MENDYKKRENWLFPEVNPYIDKDDFREAFEFLKAEVSNTPPSSPIVVNFSGGKDSLACLALAEKVKEELNDNRELIILTSLTGYEDFFFNNWFKYLKKALFPRFNWLTVKPPLIVSYSVETLGLGKPPIEMPQMSQCNGRWKQAPLDFAYKLIPKNRVEVCGIRGEESPKRAERLIRYGRVSYFCSKYLTSPLGYISTPTLWAWLEKELFKYTGVEFAKLQEYYKYKKRDGCWLCRYNKTKENLTPFQAWVQDFNKKVWSERTEGGYYKQLEINNYQQMKYKRLKLNDYTTATIRAPLSWRKKWLKEVLEAECFYNETFLTKTHLDLIREIWAYSERYKNDFGELAGMAHWNHYKNDYIKYMINPYLRSLAFEEKTLKDGKKIDVVKKGELVFYNKIDRKL